MWLCSFIWAEHVPSWRLLYQTSVNAFNAPNLFWEICVDTDIYRLLFFVFCVQWCKMILLVSSFGGSLLRALVFPNYLGSQHYSDVIMRVMASQITGVRIICSSSASLAFMMGIHRWPVDSPHKGTVTRTWVILRQHHSWIDSGQNVTIVYHFQTTPYACKGGSRIWSVCVCARCAPL